MVKFKFLIFALVISLGLPLNTLSDYGNQDILQTFASFNYYWNISFINPISTDSQSALASNPGEKVILPDTILENSNGPVLFPNNRKVYLLFANNDEKLFNRHDHGTFSMQSKVYRGTKYIIEPHPYIKGVFLLKDIASQEYVTAGPDGSLKSQERPGKASLWRCVFSKRKLGFRFQNAFTKDFLYINGEVPRLHRERGVDYFFPTILFAFEQGSHQGFISMRYLPAKVRNEEFKKWPCWLASSVFSTAGVLFPEKTGGNAVEIPVIPPCE